MKAVVHKTDTVVVCENDERVFGLSKRIDSLQNSTDGDVRGDRGGAIAARHLCPVFARINTVVDLPLVLWKVGTTLKRAAFISVPHLGRMPIARPRTIWRYKVQRKMEMDRFVTVLAHEFTCFIGERVGRISVDRFLATIPEQRGATIAARPFRSGRPLLKPFPRRVAVAKAPFANLLAIIPILRRHIGEPWHSLKVFNWTIAVTIYRLGLDTIPHPVPRGNPACQKQRPCRRADRRKRNNSW